MSYQGISIQGAVGLMNNEWFLPAIQRPYVWGSRYDAEEYIFKIFDSLVRGYPIGGLILWKTKKTIPHREFFPDYESNKLTKLVDSGLNGREKYLVYDGQQRLQTLFSCLKHTFEGRVLVFDVRFDFDRKKEQSETGFSFTPKNSSDAPWWCVRINQVFSSTVDDKVLFRKKVIAQIPVEFKSEELENQVERNIEQLWRVFVEKDRLSLSYFPIDTSNEDEVNEIFNRLNTGGVALSQADILFSALKVKDVDPLFEEKLQEASQKIRAITQGYIFDAYQILQLIHLIVKGAVRVDPKKVRQEELKKFIEVWSVLEGALYSFFSNYIWGKFHINNASIVPKKLAVLPMIVYFYHRYKDGGVFSKLPSETLKGLDQYFIVSQVNDWNVQSLVDGFSKIITDCHVKRAQEEGDSDVPKTIFPFTKMKELVDTKKLRNISLVEELFLSNRWFALKILLPNRVYVFQSDMQGRFNPEIDHIFPKKLPNQNENFAKEVDVLWNMQPIKGDVNNLKLNINPQDFFKGEHLTVDGAVVDGSKYLSDYDFLPPIDDAVWRRPDLFIQRRKREMLEFIEKKYGLTFRSDSVNN
jgi:hypothetical protein